MGNQLPVQNSSTFTKNPDRVWGSKFVVKRPSHQFNQSRIIIWLSIPSCQWSHNPLWFYMMNTAPTDNKRLRVDLNVNHIMRSRTLYWQFCWDLVPSKLTTHRNWLLRTRSWSHRQFQSIFWQLRKKYQINWICLWTRRELFSEMNCLKINFWLMHSWPKCSCLTQG